MIFKVSQLVKHVPMHARGVGVFIHCTKTRRASKIKGVPSVRSQISGRLRRSVSPLQRNYSTLFDTLDSGNPSRCSPPARLPSPPPPPSAHPNRRPPANSIRCRGSKTGP